MTLESLYHTHSEFVYRICLRYAKDHESAEDLMQDVFLKIFGNIKHFESRSQLSTWIYKITINMCIDFFRKESRKQTLLIDNLDPLVIHNLSYGTEDRAIAKIELERIMKPLRPTLRRMVFLYYAEGLTYEEIATVLGLKKSAVAKAIGRFISKNSQNLKKVPVITGSIIFLLILKTILSIFTLHSTSNTITISIISKFNDLEIHRTPHQSHTSRENTNG